MASVRTFKNLCDEALNWLNEAGDTSITLALVKQAMRAAHERRLTEERWAFKLSQPKLFATVANQQTYTLDQDLSRLMYVKNLTTQEFLVEHTDQNIIRAGYDWSIDTDSARLFSLQGTSEVQNQPAAASAIVVTSSNSGDNNLNSVTLTGDTANGVQTETILASATGTLLFTEILKVSKSSGWNGTMTLTAGSTTLLTLLAAEYGKSYRQFYLLAKPTTSEQLEYRFYRQPSALVNDNDRPDYPTPFEELLVWETLCDLATYNNYDPAIVQYWSGKMNGLALAMSHAFEAQTINQAAVYTTYIPR